MTPLRIEPEAEQELEEAAVRYDQERAGLGRRFLSRVAVTLDRVSRFPRAGAPVRFVPADLPVRRAPVKGFPYHAVYLIGDGEIKVLAFAHSRRRPGYWFDRSSR